MTSDLHKFSSRELRNELRDSKRHNPDITGELDRRNRGSEREVLQPCNYISREWLERLHKKKG